MRRSSRSFVALPAAFVLGMLVPLSTATDTPRAEPAHAIAPADTIDASPAGQRRWLLDHGRQGNICDAHAHLFIIPKTSPWGAPIHVATVARRRWSNG